MIIELKNRLEENIVRSRLNDLISETQDRTVSIEDFLSKAPDMLAGYESLRAILRYIKRGHTLEEAVKKYAFEHCPPEKNYSAEETDSCGLTTCSDCWNAYCLKYAKQLDKK